MRKLVLFILCILFVCSSLSGCTSQGKIQQTNEELTIHNLAPLQFSAEVFEKYRSLYPDVKLNVIETEFSGVESQIEFCQKLNTELLSGNGPDLIYIDKGMFSTADVNKMIRTGVFSDLNEFIIKDNSLIMENYNQAVWNSCKLNEKQYMIPLSYTIPFVLSGEKAINKSKIDLTKCSEYFGFTEQVENYLETSTSNSPRVFRSPYSFRRYLFFMGLNILDYDNNKVHLDSNELKKAATYYKKLYPQESVEEYTDKTVAKALKGSDMVFEHHSALPFDSYFYNINEISKFDKPVVTPIRDLNGGIQAEITTAVAIRNNSCNKQNAYNFIKLMLENEEQTSTSLCTQIPLSYSAARTYFEKNFTSKHEVFADGLIEVIDPIPNEYFDTLMNMTREIKGAYIRNPGYDIFMEIMQPYYKGEKSYEDCINEAQQKLKIYLSE